MKRDLYQEVTNQILSQLEAGVAPWVKPWTGSKTGVPANAVTGKAYRGINVVLLSIAAQAAGYKRDLWLTFKQALAAGVPVKKGETATRIYFYKRHEIKIAGETVDGEQGEKSKVIPLLREYCVFNVEQLSGPLPGLEDADQAPAFADHAAAEQFVGATGARITNGGDGAFYQPGGDYIGMPAKAAFRSEGDYYATLLHELTHWTGHKSRCDRLGRLVRFGDEAYAAEELVAEMGAAFLCGRFGIAGRLQHASYIASWIKVLKNDKRAIFTASSLAQKACDYLDGIVGAAAGEEEVAA
jgi:antirestriction protein ArdC